MFDRELPIRPTEDMENAVRGMLMYDGRRTYGGMRNHYRQGGWGGGLKYWPKWALNAPDEMYIPKANFAALIWEVMARVHLDEVDREGEKPPPTKKQECEGCLIPRDTIDGSGFCVTCRALRKDPLDFAP